jgi:hypothetical protein
MKTLIMIISILGFTTLSSCTQKIDVSKLLDNSKTRSDVFKAIASDHDLMMSFMESIQSNEHSMQMMQGNYMMMGNMMKGSGMHMMMKDSMTMHNMMVNIMKNEKMMGNMIHMMNNEAMMSNECMQAIMKTMNDKSMNMNGMGMMNQDEDNNK